MDQRVALQSGTVLRLSNDRGEVIHCVIEKEIGRGGSCIVYEASRITDTGDKSLYRIKEFYPYRLEILRDEGGALVPADRHRDEFERARIQFRSVFSHTNRLFYSDSNYASMTNQLDIFSINGTLYILSAYSSEKTLAVYRPESIKECIALVRQAACALDRIHKQGYLYLDLKPGNVLVAGGYPRQIQLFDFDSLFSLQNSTARGSSVRLSYSKGFAPVELRTSKLRRLGPHTDVYSIGALLFYLLFGRTPDAPDCEPGAVYDFSAIQYDSSKCDNRLFRALTDFFHNALAVYCEDRYQSMQAAAQQLQTAEKHADPAMPRIYSTPPHKIGKPGIFFGREQELEALDALMENPDYNCLFVTGMGGIGKSTFIREYLASRRSRFDTVLYVHYKGSIEATVSDDSNIEINTLRQEDMAVGRFSDGTQVNIAESGALHTERYFDKKLRRIRELVRGSRSVLVIDNFTGEADDDLRALLSTDLKVVLLSRKAPACQNSPELRLSALSDKNALRCIFEENLGRLLEAEEQKAFGQILQHIECHTLVLELTARQIAASHITVQYAASLMEKCGFSSIAPEKVDYERDSRQISGTIGNIIDELFEVNELSEKKKALLKAASLLSDDGMNINSFQQFMGLASKDELNELISSGWLTISGDVISMHRVIREAVHRREWQTEYLSAAEQLLCGFYTEIRIESTADNYPRKLLESRKTADYEEAANIKPADIKPADKARLLSLAAQSADILRQCRREPAVMACEVYRKLHCITLLNTPMYREEYILAETSRIFSEYDRVLDCSSRKAAGNALDNAAVIMKLYDMAVSIHAGNKRFDEAERLLGRAAQIAEKARRSGRRSVYALYCSMLSGYYDIRLDGAYDTDGPDEELLLKKLTGSIEKTIRYSRRGADCDFDHLYAESLLAEAVLLIRSGRGSEKKIFRLIKTAETVIMENTLPYADVRLHYYLVCAWYNALLHDSAELAEPFIEAAQRAAEVIISSDLQKIEEVIVPCANIYFELCCHAEAAGLLSEGTGLCARHANNDSYARVKKELCGHIWQVFTDARQLGLWDEPGDDIGELCRSIIEIIDAENEEIINPENRIDVPEEIRRFAGSGTR